MKAIIYFSSREVNILSNVSSVLVLFIMIVVSLISLEQYLLQAILSFGAFALNLYAYLEITKIYRGYVEINEKQKDKKSGIAALSAVFAMFGCYFVASYLGFI